MRTVHERIATLLTEVLTDRGKPLSTVPIPANTLRRVTGGHDDYMLSTLVEVSEALGYDVVVNLRVKA
jgi:hypothetical protein